MRKEFIIILVALSILLVGCYSNNNSSNDTSKGGNNALSIFDVDSDKLTITYDGKVEEYTDDTREDLITIFKKIAKEEKTLEESKEINYDVMIDFNNGNTARLSLKDKIFDLGWEKLEVSQDDIEKITGYLNNE